MARAAAMAVASLSNSPRGALRRESLEDAPRVPAPAERAINEDRVASDTTDIERFDRFFEEHTAVLILNHRAWHGALSKAVFQNDVRRSGRNSATFDFGQRRSVPKFQNGSPCPLASALFSTRRRCAIRGAATACRSHPCQRRLHCPGKYVDRARAEEGQEAIRSRCCSHTGRGNSIRQPSGIARHGKPALTGRKQGISMARRHGHATLGIKT